MALYTDLNNEEQKLLPESTKVALKGRLITVEPLAVLYGFACGIVFIGQTIYIEERLANDRNYTLDKGNSENGTCATKNSSDPDYITQQEIAAELATWAMINIALSFLPVVFVAPFYGALCDRYGRKLNFILPLLSHILYSIIALLTVYLQLPLAVLALGNFVMGLGGNYCFFEAGYLAYISNISTEKSRLVRMAIVHMLFILCIGSIQIPVSYLFSVSIAAVFWSTFAFSFAALLYVTIPGILEEPVFVQDTKDPISFKEITQNVYNLFAVNTEGRRYRLVLLFVIYFFTALFQLSSGATAIYGLYGLGPPFCWSARTLALFNLTFLAFSAAGMLGGTKVLSICLSDDWILQIAFCFGAVSNVLLAFAPSTTLFFLAAILGSPRGMDTTAISSTLSKLVTTSELGTAFAVLSSIHSAANVVSPLVLNTIYISTVKTNPSLVINIIGAVFFTLIVLTGIWILYSRKMTQTTTTTTTTNVECDTIRDRIALKL